jgi:osmoprotectant transport system permease protein
VTEQLALLPTYLTAHLQLALAALLVGIAISIPLGVLAARVRWLEQPVLGLAGVIQTIPGLALLAIMVPLLAAANLPSIGYLPAFIALVLYSVLPILRNTVTGLAGIDPALVEAARGVGMTPRQRLLRVELPLAMPVIIAGIRTATIWTVGMATLSTPVGATSLGNYIFTGLQTRNQAAILVGCIAAAVLALTLDALVRLLARAWDRGHRILLALAVTALALPYLYMAISLTRDRDPDRIIVGAKPFTEQYILSEILAAHLEHETGSPTEVAQSLGSTVAFDALRTGDIDVYVDYSGTIWTTIMRRDATPADRAQVVTEIDDYLRTHHGISVVGALGFENAYALAMRRDTAARLGIRRLSDLAPHAATMTLGADYEFLGRPEWRAVRKTYGFTFAAERTMDPSLMYQAAANGNVDIITAYTTDGRIAAMDLVIIEDDRGAIPPYDAIILASPQLQRRHPKAIAALRTLTGTIDADTMRGMNRAVDEAAENPATVAKDFLELSGSP